VAAVGPHEAATSGRHFEQHAVTHDAVHKLTLVVTVTVRPVGPVTVPLRWSSSWHVPDDNELADGQSLTAATRSVRTVNLQPDSQPVQPGRR
jgi:hypothetical protein